MLRFALTALAVALLGSSTGQAQDVGSRAPGGRLPLDGSRLQPGRWLYTHYLLPASAARPETSTPGAISISSPSGTLSGAWVYLELFIGPFRPPSGDSLARPDAQAHADTAARVEQAYKHDSTAQVLGPTEFVITDTLYGGVPSWRLTVVGTRGGLQFADSLWVQRADLRPQHWGATLGLARLAAEFTRDSIFAGASSPAGRRSLEAAAPADLLVNESMADVALRLLPLSAGMAESLSIVVADVGAIATPPARLLVEGEERVVVPAGVFDCWVVSLQTERGRVVYWVSRNPQLVVKSEQVLPQVGGAVLRRELVRN